MSKPRLSSKSRRITAFALLACVAASTVPTTRSATACVILGGGTTKVAGEEVLIAWDAASHTEHFVRHLSFRDASHDFGFLVPTPTRPELAEANDSIFTSLFDLYHRVMRSHAIPTNADGMRTAEASAVMPVQVLEHRQVAGLDATVLSATDSQALAAWLNAHHYPSSPTLAQYLEPYVRQHWTVTAFRFDPGAGNTAFGTRALRMTFHADHPFFPYAEPTDAPTVPGRVFRISVISNERVEGREGSHVWTARTAFAGRPSFSSLVSSLPAGALTGATWLTTFQEDNSRRGRDDLFFIRAADQSTSASTIDDHIQ